MKLRLPRWLSPAPREPRYHSGEIERHLRELGLSPYPAEELQRGW